MRVSSLSDDRVIELVSRHFVPAWISRDRYQLDKIDREEQDLVARIDASRRQQKLEGGAVCVYIATSSGKVLATLPVQKASKPDLLVPFLKKIIADEKLKPRGKDIKPSAAAAKPAPKTEGGRLFAVRTRFDIRENRGTSRDIIELTKAEWSALLAPAKAKVGTSWKVPAKTAEKLLKMTYPPLPHWDAKLAKLEKCVLTATVSAVKNGESQLRLEGNLELIYPHKGEPTDGRMTAKVVGLARCEGEKLTALGLTSDESTYVWHWQGKRQPPMPMSFAIELLP
jgi:hypothetical protein